MKLSIALCVLALFLGAAYATDFDYTTIAPSDYSKHPLIPGLRDTGIDFIVNLAYKNKAITTKDFALTQTNFVEFRRAAGSSGNKFYNYNVSLVNAHNKNETLSARFLVRYNCADEEQTVISWKYKFAIHTWVETPICPACSEPKPEPEPVEQEEETVEVPEEAPVEQEEEEAVEEEVVEEEIVVEVPYEETPVEEEAAEEVIEEEVAEEVAEEVEIIEEHEEAEDLEELEQEELQQEEATTPPKEPNTSTGTETIVYPWILLPSETYDSEFHQDNAIYGTNYLVNQEVARGNLTAGTWGVSVVNEIYEQTLPDATNYRYHLYGDRAEDTYIYNFTFGLKFSATGRRSMGFYRFQTLNANGDNISTGTLPELAPPKNATQNVTTEYVDGKPVSSTPGQVITGN